MYKLCANWVMVSCYNSICTRDIQEIDKMGCQKGRTGGIVTLTSKKTPNQQQNFAMSKYLLAFRGCSQTEAPQTGIPPKTSLSCRKCPHRVLPCRGVSAFPALSRDVPRDGPVAAEAAASWGVSVHPQGPCPFQSHAWHWVWHCWSTAGGVPVKEDRKRLSSSVLQLQGLRSPWPPLVQSHPTRSHQPETQILMYMHFSGCFPWGILNFIELLLWTVMNIIFPLFSIFQNPASRHSFFHPVLFFLPTPIPTCFSSLFFCHLRQD